MTSSTVTEFRLPDVGEGLTEAEIVAWHVAVGDTVGVNDLLVEVETAKAVVELPSPEAGTVTAIHVAAGETVPVGAVLISLGASVAPTDTDTPLVLVGTGPTEAVARQRRLTPRRTKPIPRSSGPVASRTLTRTVDVTATVELCAQFEVGRGRLDEPFSPAAVLGRTLALVTRHRGVEASASLSEISEMPRAVAGQVLSRQVATVTVSFHGAGLDDGLARAVLEDVAEVLHDPRQAFLHV